MICGGGLAAGSRVRVGGAGAIVIGYVGGSRVEFATTGDWCLPWLIGTVGARVTCQSLPQGDCPLIGPVRER